MQNHRHHRAKMGTFEVGRFESSLTFALDSCTLDVMSAFAKKQAKGNADELMNHPEATRDAS